MARITISDVLPFVDNKYELGMLAGQRVRDLNGGEEPVIQAHPRDKATVTALREIASGKLDIDALRSEFIQSYKKTPVADENAETLESNAATPELNEYDAEIAGETAMKEQIAKDAADGSESGGAEADADAEIIAAIDAEIADELSESAESAE